MPNDGDTRLVLTHTVPEAAREFGLPVLAGWHSLLEQLVALLDDQPFAPDRWQELHDHYARVWASWKKGIESHDESQDRDA